MRIIAVRNKIQKDTWIIAESTSKNSKIDKIHMRATYLISFQRYDVYFINLKIGVFNYTHR